MKKEMKQILKTAFEAPMPQQKACFFEALQKQKKDGLIQDDSFYHQTADFLMTQMGYISRWIWAGAFFIFAAAAGIGIILPEKMLWILSALMPFLAVTGVLETVRSEIYGMAELEQACRYGLNRILFARILVIGTVHFFVFSAGIFFLELQGGLRLWQNAVYLCVPYLLTSSCSLWLMRHVHGREGAYGAAAAALLTAVLPEIFAHRREILYAAENFKWWMVICLLLLLCNILQYQRIIRHTEELSWNLK